MLKVSLGAGNFCQGCSFSTREIQSGRDRQMAGYMLMDGRLVVGEQEQGQRERDSKGQALVN